MPAILAKGHGQGVNTCGYTPDKLHMGVSRMASSVSDALKIAKAAEERASATAQPAQAQTAQYEDLFGPVEVPGGRADAFIVRQISTGVEHIEYRPRNGGRVKRTPLTAVTALFPQITGGDAS